jgi:hypothetical protein
MARIESMPQNVNERFFQSLLILITCLTATSSFAQPGCKALDKQTPLIYLSMEGSDKEQIWLMLHNNTTCAINVQTNNGPQRWRALRLANGSSKIELRHSMFDDDLVDSEVVRDLIYELRDIQNDRMIKTTSNGHLIFTRRIPSGANVRISIPLSSRKRGRSLSVPFSYDWEQEERPSIRGRVAHQIYFRFPAKP